MTDNPDKPYSKRSRRGAAIVEMAVCLPVLVLLVWGTIETSNSIFKVQAIKSAAHEGAMIGLNRNATASTIVARSREILEARGLEPCEVIVMGDHGESYDSLSPGDLFHVQILQPQTTLFINLNSVSASVSGIRP